MAGMLIIFKRTRPNTNITWYNVPDRLDMAQQAEKLIVFSSQTEMDNGRSVIRTLYFPTIIDYNNWNASTSTAEIISDRTRYHIANNITEIKEIIVLSNI